MKKTVILLIFLVGLIGFGCLDQQKKAETNITVAPAVNCPGCYNENNTTTQSMQNASTQPKPTEQPPIAPTPQPPDTAQNITEPPVQVPPKVNQTQISNNTNINNSTNQNVSTQPAPKPPAPVQTTGCVGPKTYDIYTPSNTTYQGKQYEDVCVVATTVKKYYCMNDKMMNAMNAECPDKYWCQGGACVEYVGVCKSTSPDSAGRGQITYTPSPFTTATEKDECMDMGLLKKWMCNGSTPYTVEVLCGSGWQCSEGRCVRVNCNDTDGGDVPAVSGIVTLGNATAYDECTSNETLQEQYCYGNSIKRKKYLCNGECIDRQCNPLRELS